MAPWVHRRRIVTLAAPIPCATLIAHADSQAQFGSAFDKFMQASGGPDKQERIAHALRPGPPATFASRAGIALAALATLGVANFAIWQKEDLIAHGQPIYVELAPADPRSLMQGDFMRLNFAVPADAQRQAGSLLGNARPRVVARRDARGVATVLRQDTGAPLQADELRIELTPKDGRWILVSDAWFFKEGQAQRWAAAKYGEFRVESSGRALLVGLRGATLEPL